MDSCREAKSAEGIALRRQRCSPTVRGAVITYGLPTTRWEPVERETQRQEFGSLYAPASNGWSFAPRIKSHKIAAGSPNVNGMFANRLTIFA
jgi:hypothetical protein